MNLIQKYIQSKNKDFVMIVEVGEEKHKGILKR